jgi:hypothetical protein
MSLSEIKTEYEKNFQSILQKLENRQINAALIDFKTFLNVYQKQTSSLTESDKTDLKKHLNVLVSNLKKDTRKYNYVTQLLENVMSDQKISLD